HHVDSIDVTVTVERPAEPLLTADAYDLLIVAPEEFTDALQPLVQHKEDSGLATKMVTLDEIYSGDHFSVEGRDNPEQVKYFIKSALEDWGITYVMLVGDADVFPTRYVVSDAIDEPFPSDLYYADVYHANGSFASWDEDSDDTFGERVDDDIDTYPDVALGRLPADTAGDVERMVTSIVAHDDPHSPPTDAVFVGTELFWDTDISEGDYLKEQVRLETPQLDVTRLYERDVYPREDISSTENVAQAINDGTTFVNFASHGYPGGMAWDAGGWSISDVERLQPSRAPVVFAMACSTNQFDTTDCLGELFLLEGNAVGYIGSVRVAYVYLNEAITTGLSGALDIAFYRAYRDGATRLGETFARAQTGYLQNHPFSGAHDHFTLLEYNMLGDPSLRLPPLDGTSQAVVDREYVTDDTVTMSAAAHGYSDDATVQLFYRRAATRWSSWQPYGEPRGQPWEWQVSLDEGEGRYEFYTVLHDGNYTEPEPDVADAACVLDTEPPAIMVTQPTGGLYIAGRQLLSRESDFVVALGAVDVAAEITDETAGVDTVTFSLDGETLETAAMPPYRLPLQGPLFGSHEVTVSATDRAGNTATDTTSRWFFKPL
ncbi:MAG: C25 family cysteine peptidase, partial [Thermoplasmatota archaeon]